MSKVALYMGLVCMGAVCYAASITPKLPVPKTVNSKTVISYYLITNVVGTPTHMDEVTIKYYKRFVTTCNDLAPLGDESAITVKTNDDFLFQFTTVKPKPAPEPALTLEQWKAIQPPVPPITNQ
jgi:hypothetical protein